MLFLIPDRMLPVNTEAAGEVGIFGDGSDGEPIFDGATNYATYSSRSGSVYTLTRSVFFKNATVNSGVTLNASGFRIFCSGTLLNSGTISNSGVDGGIGNSALTGGTAWT